MSYAEITPSLPLELDEAEALVNLPAPFVEKPLLV
jgi:hypothetical protein